jgi:hypothetical protein
MTKDESIAFLQARIERIEKTTYEEVELQTRKKDVLELLNKLLEETREMTPEEFDAREKELNNMPIGEGNYY